MTDEEIIARTLKITRPTPGEPPISPEEAKALEKAVSEHLKASIPFVYCFFMLGLAFSEVLASEVARHFEREGSKDGRSRVINLTDLAKKESGGQK